MNLPDWRKARIISTNTLDEWQLVDEMFLPIGGGKFLHIRAGFKTDCASIPRLARVFYTPHNPKWRAAAIGHDALYASELLPRKQADSLLAKWMKAENNNSVRRFLFWSSVRIGGGFVWKNHTAKSIKNAKEFVSIIDSSFTS